MKTTFNTLLIAGILFSGVILTGCSKHDTVEDLNNNPQLLTMSHSVGAADDGTVQSGMLNREFIVVNATDGKTNTTTLYDGYTFKFSGTQPTGEATATSMQGTETGTWMWRDGSSGFVMDFSGTKLEQREYLTREWTMQPTTSAYTINMVSTDGDQLQLQSVK